MTFELAPGVELGGEGLPVVAGPCVVESPETTLAAARAVAAIGERLGLAMIFKASFDKANRSDLTSPRGPGLAAGLEILAEVRSATGLPLLTDVHDPRQCAVAAEICDVLQIPAFLCRQTDLIVEAGRTGRAINIKKGQFMAPSQMLQAVEKARSTGNERVCVTERGASFGYGNLVVDMRSFTMLHRDGIAVLYDVTHSLQLPGTGVETGGAREYAEPLARAAVAAGADGLFIEVHPNPAEALSDSSTQLDLQTAERLLAAATRLRERAVPAT